MQRRIWTESANGIIYPNLYVLLVAPPGIGKSETIKRIGELWRAVEDLHVAPSSVTRAALIDVLARSNVKIVRPEGFQIFHGLNVASTEFGVICPAHDLEFLNTLNDLFDCGDSYSEERRHRQEQVDIKYPILNILGGTQPGFLSELLPEQAWSMGFTSRLLMIYSAQEVEIDLFSVADPTAKTSSKKTYDNYKKSLAADLHSIAQMYGPVEWDKDAAEALITWYKRKLEPVPTHSRLQHYKVRRLLSIFKLSMISSVSRGSDLRIMTQDLTRAQDWLLEAEGRMPDIFRDMAGKSDKLVIDDLHAYMWRMWIRDKKSIHESKVISFLSNKVPSEKILKIIELCERAGVIEKDRSTPHPMWIPALNKENVQGVE